ncbi:hypothetical protein [Streptomyces sp. NPDC005408]|uniref:hypothetical protein n=1 Tax=Streptomyces sp. NPDC005408 TaxID=3155341 RepID=UPI0033B4B0D7
MSDPRPADAPPAIEERGEPPRREPQKAWNEEKGKLPIPDVGTPLSPVNLFRVPASRAPRARVDLRRLHRIGTADGHAEGSGT